MGGQSEGLGALGKNPINSLFVETIPKTSEPVLIYNCRYRCSKRRRGAWGESCTCSLPTYELGRLGTAEVPIQLSFLLVGYVLNFLVFVSAEVSAFGCCTCLKRPSADSTGFRSWFKHRRFF